MEKSRASPAPPSHWLSEKARLSPKFKFNRRQAFFPFPVTLTNTALKLYIYSLQHFLEWEVTIRVLHYKFLSEPVTQILWRMSLPTSLSNVKFNAELIKKQILSELHNCQRRGLHKSAKWWDEDICDICYLLVIVDPGPVWWDWGRVCSCCSCSWLECVSVVLMSKS